jgi:hypothetical protein
MRFDRRYLVVIAWLSFWFFSPAGAGSSAGEAAAATPGDQAAEKTAADTDTTMKLRGGEEGTIFKSLRIEGEDRVRIEFERPPLALDLDPKKAPGLDWESFQTVLDRNGLDLFTPYLLQSAVTRPPRFAWPWFDGFATGSVARFRPLVEGVARWRLTVANSRGETVATFEGKGKPPKEIGWDGKSVNGGPAAPGLTYSYVLEAYDKAGNKRNFVGDGFQIPPYLVHSSDGVSMLFSVTELRGAATTTAAPTPPLLFEAASWINQTSSTGRVVRVEVTARSFEEASAAAESVLSYLRPLILGDPARVQPVTRVEPDATDGGTVVIAVAAKPR